MNGGTMKTTPAKNTILRSMPLALFLILSGCGGSSSNSARTTPPATPGCTTDCGTPASLGSISGVAALPSCPAAENYAAGMSCFQASVSCPNTADIGVTYGYLAPAGSIKGTIFFHGGGDGTLAQDISDYGAAYTAAGYAMVQMAWATKWEDTGLTAKDVGKAACRPATLMNYIFENVAPSGAAKCAQGFSAGSAAVGYTLAWYGGGSYLDNAELVSGPVFSDIQQGCEYPQPPLLNICTPGQLGCPANSEFQDSPSYTPGTALGVGGITGDASCGGNPNGNTPTTSQSNANWKAMSIVSGTSIPSFNYPQTSLAGWVCNNGTVAGVGNNSAAQGDIFYQQFSSAQQTGGSFSLNPVSNCNGDEGVDQGTVGTLAGSVAISNDTIAHCIVRH
jgi:hypothetical protein